MIITLPTITSGEKSFISEKFGRCNFFYVFDTETGLGKVYTNIHKDDERGAGIKAAEYVLNQKTDVLITPHVGEKTIDVLKSTDIKIYHSTEEIVKKNIESYLNNELEELL
ncbi:MAG: NifB/NifX family molybdenum-iron cluster-binding protein [Bacilli bacterium]|nr:NifB/NifX family molybdenum-iron cluster-binding protein [Bacilli bacterium]